MWNHQRSAPLQDNTKRGKRFSGDEPLLLDTLPLKRLRLDESQEPTPASHLAPDYPMGDSSRSGTPLKPSHQPLATIPEEGADSEEVTICYPDSVQLPDDNDNEDEDILITRKSRGKKGRKNDAISSDDDEEEEEDRPVHQPSVRMPRIGDTSFRLVVPDALTKLPSIVLEDLQPPLPARRGILTPNPLPPLKTQVVGKDPEGSRYALVPWVPPEQLLLKPATASAETPSTLSSWGRSKSAPAAASSDSTSVDDVDMDAEPEVLGGGALPLTPIEEGPGLGVDESQDDEPAPMEEA